MNLLRRPVRFSGRRSFIRPTGSCWYTITHQVTQTILKPIYKSPSASRRLLKFFKSISWITSSLAGASSVSRKQDFCKYLQKPNWRMDRAPCHATSCVGGGCRPAYGQARRRSLAFLQLWLCSTNAEYNRPVASKRFFESDRRSLGLAHPGPQLKAPGSAHPLLRARSQGAIPPSG